VFVPIAESIDTTTADAIVIEPMVHSSNAFIDVWFLNNATLALSTRIKNIVLNSTVNSIAIKATYINNVSIISPLKDE
jgi:hypothetical protein